MVRFQKIMLGVMAILTAGIANGCGGSSGKSQVILHCVGERTTSGNLSNIRSDESTFRIDDTSHTFEGWNSDKRRFEAFDSSKVKVGPSVITFQKMTPASWQLIKIDRQTGAATNEIGVNGLNVKFEGKCEQVKKPPGPKF